MANRLPTIFQQFFTADPDVREGSLLYSYAAGTSTPLATYTDKNCTVGLENTNPIVLDSLGQPPNAVFLTNVGYKFILKTSAGVTVWTADDVFTSDYSARAKVPGYSGNPNTHVAGTAASGSTAADLVLDYANNILYACTSTGTALTAVWTSLSAPASLNYAINEGRTTVASAATTLIGAAAANYCLISGTVTITAFDSVAAGAARTLEFQGSLTLTHNGTTLILPDATNIITKAGDTAQFRSEGSGNWRCMWYNSATPAPTVQRLTSGTTYTAPAGVRRQRVAGCGGGSGGSASNLVTAPTAGGTSSFQVNATGTAWTCGGGGAGGGVNAGTGGSGGTTGPGTLIDRRNGGAGHGGMATSVANVASPGGPGGTNPFGGAGSGAPTNTTGGTAVANSGAGGGGGGALSTHNSGGGGGAGEWVSFWVTGMTTAAYTVGAGGAGTPVGAGDKAGGAGADGIWIVEEFYA